MSDGGLAILRERVAALPAILDEAARAPLPEGAEGWRALRGAERFVLTGGGLSEGPARVLCALLRRRGRDARFVAQSELAGAPGPRPELDGAILILFSQGLAPNARLPLPWLGTGICGPDGARVFARGMLVTSVVPTRGPGDDAGETGVAGIARRLVDAGHVVWTLPPAREDRLLLRVLGPAVAVLAAIRLADAITSESDAAAGGVDADDLRARVARALAAGVDLFGDARRPIAIVAEPALCELAMPLRWKLLEGLRVPDPPVWDPLQVAHGPLQALYQERATVIALRTDALDPVMDDLFARLRSVLHPDHQRWIELRVAPGPLALLELDARLDAALLATLARHPLALDDWPTRGHDGPVYDVDPHLLRGTP
jgi:hypothetical protein